MGSAIASIASLTPYPSCLANNPELMDALIDAAPTALKVAPACQGSPCCVAAGQPTQQGSPCCVRRRRGACRGDGAVGGGVGGVVRAACWRWFVFSP